MRNTKIGWLSCLSALALANPAIYAQEVPASGLYQIVSGRYVACCGIFGPLTRQLPDAGDAFIELSVDSSNNRAQMRILGQDMHTVLSLSHASPRAEFVYSLTNGIIFPDYIQFGDPGLLPIPDRASFSFVVSNSLDTLRINGMVIAPCDGCADVPTEFQHTNVTAVAMPSAAIRVSEVEMCWNTVSNRTYQAQYRSTATTDAWVNLGPPVTGSGSANCLTHMVPPGHPQRYYRVVIQP